MAVRRSPALSLLPHRTTLIAPRIVIAQKRPSLGAEELNMKSDAKLQKDVLAKLHWDPSITPHRLALRSEMIKVVDNLTLHHS